MKHIIPFKIKELESQNFHLIVNGKIDNHPIYLIIDTGASYSCFDMPFIENLERDFLVEDYDGFNVAIDSSGFESKFASVHNFELGSLHIDNFSAVLVDFYHINEAYKKIGLPQVHGVLGCEFLVKYQAIIDIGRKEITLTVAAAEKVD